MISTQKPELKKELRAQSDHATAPTPSRSLRSLLRCATPLRVTAVGPAVPVKRAAAIQPPQARKELRCGS